MFDFPSSPTPGQEFTSASVTYVWNGQGWALKSSAGDFVLKAGDTMTGPLVLVGDPASPMQATTKQYTDNFVRWSGAQGLNATQQLQARQNVYAAPLDALSFNGMQINGCHDVNQEFVDGSSWRVGNGYGIDSWFCYATPATIQGSRISASQLGFPNGFWLNLNTNMPGTIGPTDAALVTTHLEGYRSARLRWGTAAAVPLTLAFWITSNRPGAYGLAVSNSGQTRGWATILNLTGGNIFDFFTITIPGDTAGTWKTDNNIGVYIVFTLCCGSSYQAPPNTWSNGVVNGPVGQGQFGLNTDWIQVVGFFAFPGIQAPTYDRLPYLARPYTEELWLCQRYFELFGSGFMGQWQNATNLQVIGKFSRRKRIVPTIGVIPGGAWNAEVMNVSVLSGSGASLLNSSADVNGGRFSLQGLNSGVANAPGSLTSQTLFADARF